MSPEQQEPVQSVQLSVREQKQLTSDESELVNFIEQRYLSHGNIPTKELCDQMDVCSPRTYNMAFNNPVFTAALRRRGIEFKNATTNMNGVLTEQQLAAINLFLDYSDKRSLAKKLQTINVTTQVWNAWNRQEAFKSNLEKRAEILLANLSEAHSALMGAVQGGDVNAIKFFYELTNRFNPKAEGMDLQKFMVQVITIIQRWVTDSNQLAGISRDLLGVIGASGINSREQVEGTIVRPPLMAKGLTFTDADDLP